MNKTDIPLRSFAKIFTGNQIKKIAPLANLIGCEGNLKIPRTIAIFNMGSGTDCPSRKLGLCAANKAKVSCYALKTERGYRPLVLPFRRRQEVYWKQITAEYFASQFLLINITKRNPFSAIRINESGDFWSQECVNKLEKIATILRRFGIKVYAYTSRRDLNFSKCHNLILSGSGFRKKGIANEFRIVKDLNEKPKGWSICKGNCRICNNCLIRGRNTVVKSH